MFTQIGSRSASAYRQVGVETSVARANPHDLVNLLFDGLLLALGSARAALQRGDIKSKCQQIVIAVRILEEGLKCALNLEQGGQLATNLNDLYGYCVMRLTQANARNDDAALAEVIALVEPVANGWKEIGGISALPQLKAA
ncbi:MAG: flagellar export chaperone FliS [Rhodoferax sp.]|nr:flagellar export chaperone FliS [Rhodoferax sp.]